MKIQCDVCDRDAASVFCVADEAALCAACDRRVHHANKLAGKHHRFSLIQCPSPKQAPICDICQERKAFLFCQQDRAILCRECDGAIHQANEQTRKHARFLLVGVKLSPNSAIYSAPPSSPEPGSKKSENNNEPVSTIRTPSTAKGTTGESIACEKSNVQSMNPETKISEDMMEMLPGWHFEEFLDSSFSSPYGFFKNGDDELLPFWDGDLESNTNYVRGYFPTGNMAQNQSGLGEQFKEFTRNYNSKSTRKWDQEHCFTVPQIVPSPNVSKRSRIL